MSIRSDLLKDGIITRLKEYDAYIDDELPDYILVMITNKKTTDQIREDLKLFLTSNTEPFIQWLENMIQDPSQLEEPVADELSDGTPYPSPPSSTHSQSPKRTTDQSTHRKRSHDSFSRITSKEQDDDESAPPPTQKIKLPPDPSEKRRVNKTWKTQETDLRSLIRKRKGESYMYSDDEDNDVIGGVSSVVQLPPKKERPKRRGGTGRLLQKAISDINSVSSSSTSANKKRKKIHVKKDINSQDEKEQLDIGEYEKPDEFQEEVNSTEKQQQQPTTVVKEVNLPHGSEVKKKSIKERLDRTPEPEDVEDDLTTVEIATLAAVRKVLPQKPLDLRHFLKTKHRSATSAEVTRNPTTPTRFVVTLDTNKEEVAKVTSSTRDEDFIGRVSSPSQTTTGGQLEKCRFWPNCKNGDSCAYHHPSVPCRLFPKCKYGSKCHYVHPLCKYDGRCTNPACYYLHSVVKNPSTNIQQNMLPFSSPFPSVSQLTYGDVPHRRSRSKYPTKSALTWSPATGAATGQ